MSRFFPASLFAITLMISGLAHANVARDAARHFLHHEASHLGHNVTVAIHPSRADLPACHHPRPFLPGTGQKLLGRVTVGVRCDSGQVRYLQARVSADGRYWEAKERIPAGTALTATMLEADHGDLGQLPHGAIRDRSAALGQVTTRTLAKGTVIQSAQLREAWLVHRRQPVTVEARGQGFRVTRSGKALQDGALGDTVRVRMADHSVLVGVVTGDN